MLPAGADVEKVERVAGEPLAFADFVAHLDRRAALRPEMLFDGQRELGDFVVGERHVCSADDDSIAFQLQPVDLGKLSRVAGYKRNSVLQGRGGDPQIVRPGQGVDRAQFGELHGVDFERLVIRPSHGKTVEKFAHLAGVVSGDGPAARRNSAFTIHGSPTTTSGFARNHLAAPDFSPSRQREMRKLVSSKRSTAIMGCPR
jgi:hypothetical protein